MKKQARPYLDWRSGHLRARFILRALLRLSSLCLALGLTGCYIRGFISRTQIAIVSSCDANEGPRPMKSATCSPNVPLLAADTGDDEFFGPQQWHRLGEVVSPSRVSCTSQRCEVMSVRLVWQRMRGFRKSREDAISLNLGRTCWWS